MRALLSDSGFTTHPLRAGLSFGGLMALPLLSGHLAWAQPDYAPAHWVPPTNCTKWYTTGNGHNFCVIHDMEGYYWTTISYLNTCSVQASVYYLVNSLQNGSDSLGNSENRPNDPVAGDLTQSVREQNYAWHALCWNKYMFGTEHEGFVSSPVWYSEEMYRASAGLQRHLCDTYGIPKDRNHIIGHDEKKNAAWVSWMQTNWPAIDPTCNTHTDPGQYWDWSHFMALIIGGPTITNQPQSLAVNPGSDARFSVGASGTGTLSYQWRFNSTNLTGATATSYTRTKAQLIDAGSYSVVVTDTTGSMTSSNAVLTVNAPPTIIGQPQDQVVSAGQPVTFTVTASGTQPFSYQWRFNGANIPGASASSYTVISPQGADSGFYSVLMTNALGSALSSNGLLVVAQSAAWGNNMEGQSSLSPGATNLIAVAAGAWYSLGLRADGTLSAWGNDASGQCDTPPGLKGALAIAAGSYHALAIQSNGAVVAWGANDSGQTNVPAKLTKVIGIAAGTWHSVALKADGTVVAWGDDSFGQASPPAGLSNVVAVAAGGNHSLALKADGTVAAWGENTDAEGNTAGQSVVPFGLAGVVAIGAGQYHSLAVKSDGSVVAWGDNSLGQCNVPVGLSNVVAVAGGGAHSLALGADGTVTAWGSDLNGQCDIPAGMSAATGIAAGEYHSLVLLAGSLPLPRLLNPARQGSQFTALAQTLSPRHYALEFTDSLDGTNWTGLPAVTGNGALRTLTDATASGAQRFYRMRQW
jgi:N-acetyl-anhydromuramyl-L-alanine amidase AmpD